MLINCFRPDNTVLIPNNNIVEVVAKKIALFLWPASYRIRQESLLPFSSRQGFVTRFQRRAKTKLLGLKACTMYSSCFPAFVNELSCFASTALLVDSILCYSIEKSTT